MTETLQGGNKQIPYRRRIRLLKTGQDFCPKDDQSAAIIPSTFIYQND
jgi:hypothetical protein